MCAAGLAEARRERRVKTRLLETSGISCLMPLLIGREELVNTWRVRRRDDTRLQEMTCKMGERDRNTFGPHGAL